jgi:hypothetical protein
MYVNLAKDFYVDERAMNRLEPPYSLIKDRLYEGQVIPFLGSGASLGKRHPGKLPWVEGQGEHLPIARELAGYLASKAQFPEGETLDLAKVAQYFGVVGGRNPLLDDLHSIFDHDYPITSLHSFLAEIPKPLLIVTTNYDDLIERAFEGRRYDVVVQTTEREFGDQLLWWPHGETQPRRVNPNKLDIDLKEVTVVYKIHGAVDRRDRARDQYVITEDDYIKFLSRMTRNKAIPAIFAEPFQTRHFLFLGYSLGDWNLRVVLNGMERDLRQRGYITSWAIQLNPSLLEQRLWQQREVDMYNMMLEDFVTKLRDLKTG